jgi:hypothetical protein
MLAEIHMLCAEAQARVAAQEAPKYSSGTGAEPKGAESARFTEYPAPPIWKAWQLDSWHRLQGGLTETLGVPLSGFRKRNNVVSERRTNRVVVAGSGAERPERHLERDAHETDRFAVKRLTV